MTVDQVVNVPGPKDRETTSVTCQVDVGHRAHGCGSADGDGQKKKDDVGRT